MTLALASHHSVVILLFMAAAALAVGVILWSLLDEDKPLSAEEMVEHICTGGVTYPDFYDISIVATARDEISIQYGKVEYRKAPGAGHFLFTDGEGKQRTELITLLSPVSGVTDANPASEDSWESAEEHVFFRRTDSLGQWQEWITAPREPKGVRSIPESGQDTHRFCRSLPEVLGEIVEFHYVGEEIIDGANTLHFYQSHRSPGYEGYRTREFWVDSEGLFRQIKETYYEDFYREGQVEIIHEVLRTYWGWGEVNVIAAPGNATPWPLAPTR